MKSQILKALVIIFFLAGCNQKQQHINDIDDDITISEEDVSTTKLNQVDDTEKELMLNESFGELRWGLNYNQVMDILGTPEKEQSYNGEYGETYHTLKYPNEGIEVYLISTEDASAYVSKIFIRHPSKLKTKEGIGVGSTEEEVKQKYGKHIDCFVSTDDMIVVGNISYGLIFKMKKKKVVEIMLGEGAE